MSSGPLAVAVAVYWEGGVVGPDRGGPASDGSEDRPLHYGLGWGKSSTQR